jgi:hypothetical protein
LPTRVEFGLLWRHWTARPDIGAARADLRRIKPAFESQSPLGQLSLDEGSRPFVAALSSGHLPVVPWTCPPCGADKRAALTPRHRSIRVYAHWKVPGDVRPERALAVLRSRVDLVIRASSLILRS